MAKTPILNQLGRCLLVAFATTVAHAQLYCPLPVTKMPFIGEVTRSASIGVETVSRIARNTAGSTYCESGAPGQQASQLTIQDVPGKRIIILFPYSHTYELHPLPTLQPVTLLPDDVGKAIDREINALPTPKSEVGSGHETEVIGMIKLQNYMVYGVRITYKGPPADNETPNTDRTHETWTSPLFGTMKIEDVSVVNGETYHIGWIWSDLRLTTPNPALFTIPAGYALGPPTTSGPPYTAIPLTLEPPSTDSVTSPPTVPATSAPPHSPSLP